MNNRREVLDSSSAPLCAKSAIESKSTKERISVCSSPKGAKYSSPGQSEASPWVGRLIKNKSPEGADNHAQVLPTGPSPVGVARPTPPNGDSPSERIRRMECRSGGNHQTVKLPCRCKSVFHPVNPVHPVK